MAFRKYTKQYRGYNQVPHELSADEADKQRRIGKKDAEEDRARRRWSRDTTITNPERKPNPLEPWEE